MKFKWLLAICVFVLFFSALQLVKVENPQKGFSTPAQAAIEKPEDAAPATLQDWIESDARDLTVGKALAIARTDALRELIKSNPAAAMAESLSWSEWASLPAELQPLVERPFSQRVDLQVLPDCPPGERHGKNIQRVFMDGEWRTAHVFGARQKLRTKSGLPARGLVLDGEVVLAESGVERLTGADLSAAREIFGATGNTDRAVLLGGELLEISSDEKESELREVVTAAEKSLHPNSLVMAAGTIATLDLESTKKISAIASSTWTETPKRTLGVRINYSDAPAFSYTLTEMTNLMNNCSNHIKVMSYGKTALTPRVVSVTLPNVYSFYEDGGPDAIVAGTSAALAESGINTGDYDFIVHAHPGHGFGYAGLGQVGGGICWLNGNVSVEVTAHELGHNYGLGHAHFWINTTGVGPLGRNQPGSGDLIEHEEYGDPFDIMGGSDLPQGQYTAHGKAALNWIESKEVINVVTNGIYRIFRYDHKDSRTNAAAQLALKIASPGGEEFWVSHRKLFTANTSLTRAAQIHRADGDVDQSLIDATPLSRPLAGQGSDKDDSPLAIGKPFVDSMGTLEIKTIGAGGVAPLEYLDVQVSFLNNGAYSVYTTATLATNGLVGSFVNRSLRNEPSMNDWRTAGVGISGRRVDTRFTFTSNGWGSRSAVGVTGGNDSDWEDYSVQWDGFIVVRRPFRLLTISDDSSRFWIDLNKNSSFATTAPEYVNNHWGTGQGPTRGDVSGVIPPGTYAIRIQYEEGNGGNYFVLAGSELPFQFFTTAAATTPGLTGSYVGSDLRSVLTQADWRTTQTIEGTRVDPYPGFTDNSWGSLASVGLIEGPNGSDDDWEQFSVQWDGYISNSVPIRVATISDDHSRMWIDLNTNGIFSASSPELVNNGWGGGGQGMTLGAISQTIQPGLYQIRIQYEEGVGGNGMIFVGAPQFPIDAGTLFSGLVFTGTDSRTASRNVGTNFTVQFWMKSTQVAGAETRWPDGMGLLDGTATSGGSFGVSLGNGRALFGVSGAVDQTIQSQFVSDDQWHHVSARRDADRSEIALFINGILVSRASGGSDPLLAASLLTLGSLSDGSNHYIGSMDGVKIWNIARTDAQILSDYHLSRSGHGLVDPAPVVRIARLQPNSYQLFWDAISSYRKLEASVAATGPWISLPTDQNSTNVPIGANSIGFFRVKK